MMSKPFNWKCSKCSSNVLVEVHVNAVTANRFIGHCPDGTVVLDLHELLDPGAIDHYQCGNCGQIVLNNGRVVSDRNQMLEAIQTEG